MVKVTAPGKVHLIGEHSVVYGEPAIISAIGKRCFIEAEKSEKIRIKDLKMDVEEDLEVRDLKKFFGEIKSVMKSCEGTGNFLEVFKILKKEKLNAVKMMVALSLESLNINSGISIVLKSEIPTGAGLGSSASLSVAIPKAIAEAYVIDKTKEEINDIAYYIEKFNHGKPAGADNSTCCFGGLIWFQKDKPNIIKSLKDEIPYKLENFVLVYTKAPEKTTGELVQMVMDLDPSFRDPIIKNLGDAAHEMREVLKRKDFDRMKELINLTNENLTKLGLSIPETEKIAKAVKEIGGAAKMCGACYGGTMLCYHEDKERLKEVIKELGFEPWETELSVEGVKVL